MFNFMLLDFFNDMVNTLFRNVSPALRFCLILVFLAIGTFFLATSLNKKKDSADKEPIKYGRLFLCVLCYIVVGLYAFIQ